MPRHSTDPAYDCRRAEREAVLAIQATSGVVAAIHQDLCRRYSARAVSALIRPRYSAASSVSAA